MNDPGIGLLEAKGPKQKKDRTDFGTPPKAPKKALVKAGAEHEKGRPKATQSRVDGEPTISEAEAWEKFKEASAEHELKKQKWDEAKKAREVRLGDLVKVHAHKPFDDASAARVSKDTAKAVEREKKAQEAKADAKKALDAAWATVQSFSDSEPIRPLIPDDE